MKNRHVACQAYMNVSVSALKARLVLSQLLAPFPVTQESVSRGESAIKGRRR